jgi:hypothetical protein
MMAAVTHRVTLSVLLVCILLAGLLAGIETPQAAGLQLLMIPNPVVFEVAGGVKVVLQEADEETKYFRFEVCGQDTTLLSAAFPLRFRFDTPIRRVEVHAPHTGMAIGTHVADRVVTVSLSRDPFKPPEPWRLAMLIAFEHLPVTGRIAIGTAAASMVSYRITPRPRGFGTGCVDLLASGGWLQRTA